MGRLKRLFAFIFRASNNVLDIEIDPLPKSDIWASAYQITITIKPPLFWRRRTCKHIHALKQGPLDSGASYCLRCETYLPAELFR